MRLRGMFVGLLGKFMRGKVISLTMGCSGSLVGVSGKVMELGGAVVRALRHVGSPGSLDAGSRANGQRGRALRHARRG